LYFFAEWCEPSGVLQTDCELDRLASHAQIELSGKRIRLRVIQLCMLS